MLEVQITNEGIKYSYYIKDNTCYLRYLSTTMRNRDLSIDGFKYAFSDPFVIYTGVEGLNAFNKAKENSFLTIGSRK